MEIIAGPTGYDNFSEANDQDSFKYIDRVRKFICLHDLYFLLEHIVCTFPHAYNYSNNSVFISYIGV